MLFYTKKALLQAAPPRIEKNVRGIPLLEAATFWLKNNDGPIYRGLIAVHANRELRKEAKIRDQEDEEGMGLGALVRVAHRRLAAMENGRGKYTNIHSHEVATFAWTIIIEAILRNLPEAKGIDPAWIFAGGYVHDVGKTFLPQALLSKEGGIELFGLKFFWGMKLTIVERSTLRYEHQRVGSELGKIVWDRSDDAGLIIAQDMMGLHHATYNGLDGAYPSYPLGKRGMDLPFHCRIAKTADFISAVRPRPYKPVYHQDWIMEFEQALGYAIMVAGTELDPVTVSCLLTGMYDIKANDADSLVDTLKFTGEQKELSNLEFVKGYVQRICEHAEFVEVMKRRDTWKIARYAEMICSIAETFGIEIAPDFPMPAPRYDMLLSKTK